MLWWNWQGTDVENAASKLVLSVAWARVAHIVGSRGDQAPRGGCFRTVGTILRTAINVHYGFIAIETNLLSRSCAFETFA